MAKFHFNPILLATRILCAWLLSQAVLPAQVRAQTAGSVVDGVVRDTGNRPMAGVKLSLDDQVEGRTLTEVTDSAGHFRFSGLAASTYLLFARKPAYVERMEGPFVLGRGDTKTLSLVMMAEKDAPPATNAPQVLEYSDEPQFTVAGVTDPSNVGGHGSNVTLPTKEALARETASLAKEIPDSHANDTAPSELPKIAANDFVGNWEAGRKLVQSGRPKDAIVYLERALRLRPDAADASYWLATAYLRTGNPKRAEQLARLWPKEKNTDGSHALLAEILEAEGHPAEAAKEYQRAAEMAPSEANLFAWGAELLLHRAAAPAAKVFGRGHQLYPESIRMLVGLGAAAYARDLNEEAARWLLAAIALQPADPRPYLFLGKVQEVAKSEPPEWVEAFRNYVALRPDDARAHYYYAVALEKQRRGQQDFGERDAELRKAIAIEPRMGDAYLKLGLLQEEEGKLAEAVAAFQKAVEFTDLPDEAHLRLAQVYRRMGETEKARKESQLYEQISAKKKENLEKERKELGEFVVTGKP
ncbi:MAG TPA: tetratricopeptide repeat protein [Candidatus Limnocylindrales bacterium]|nr:tetratricopeptide repeat protein [Candidatus Limnocylindrales bacterium]